MCMGVHVQTQTENQPVPVLAECHLVSGQVGTVPSGQMGPEWNVNVYTSTVMKYSIICIWDVTVTILCSVLYIHKIIPI